MTLKLSNVLLNAITLIAFSAYAQAAEIRILVGAPAGGSTDTLARTLSQKLSRLLGKTVVVENRPGAGGNIAADSVAKSAPDGNMLLMSFTSHAINASLYSSLPFDPVRDFTPLTCVATLPSILVAHPSVASKDVSELIALAKAKPGKLKALGVTSSRRLPAFPDGPAIAEMLPGYKSSPWFGLFGPARMDAEMTKRISDAAPQAIGTPDVRRRLETEGAIAVGNSPEEFARFVQDEITRWAKVVKFSGAKPE